MKKKREHKREHKGLKDLLKCKFVLTQEKTPSQLLLKYREG